MRPLRAARTPAAERDRGTISVMVAALAVSLVVLVGLVLDFGGRLRAIERADALAQEAARVGGQQLDVKKLRDGAGYQLDQATADAAARAYLAGRGGSVEITFPDPQTISVTLDTDYSTALLSVVRLTTLPVHGHGKATLVHGITEGSTG
ncbi:hypothetical protein AB0K51_00230 [Kitasatospora sp. NPDC049285]|uniref:hypothetical protein n=1 Tax=Kitasatospora sp. NPDC049285 TaxID=3157096 RepID=UPI0034417F23